MDNSMKKKKKKNKMYGTYITTKVWWLQKNMEKK